MLRYRILYFLIKLQIHCCIDQNTNNHKKKVHIILSIASKIKFKYKYGI